MAELRRSLTRILLIALAPAALSALPPAATAQEAGGYGPYSGAAHADGGHHARVWRDGYCGERASVQAPDIMTYDRKTGSEVLVGDGPSGRTSVTGLNRESGSTFNVHGDLAGAETTTMCQANGVTGSAYEIRGEGPKTEVKGVDGETGRRFEVSQGPGGHGPDFKSADPLTHRSVEVITAPDGQPIVREFGPHALACTRARLGLGAGVKAELGDLKAGASGRAGVTLGLGDC